MKTLRRLSSDIQDHCQSLHEDDGVDPRRYFRSKGSDEAGSKNRRFCGHIAKTLNVILASSGNPVLARLFVVDVLPAPNLRRLEVVIDATQVETGVTGEAIKIELHGGAHYLRSEVGRAIMRKYVPELFFRLASPGEVFR